MSLDDYFKIPKKVVYTIFVFLVMGLFSAGGMVIKGQVNKTDTEISALEEEDKKLAKKDAILSETIKVNQEAIHAQTQMILFTDKNLAVLEEKVVGHEKNTTAHDK